MTLTINIDQISQFLLSQKFLLTALELDFELIERGNENRILRNFFTNPDNFEKVSTNFDPVANYRMRSSPSQSTLDSCDYAKSSDDGYDEKIKVLEFELRKKTDEVKKLREELTHISSYGQGSDKEEDDDEKTCSWNTLQGDRRTSRSRTTDKVLANESRALNFLINEYLMTRGFRLTAVSLSEEVAEQDLDSWDDVGLNMAKLPPLETLLRSARRSRASSTAEWGGQVDLQSLEQEQQLVEMQQRLDRLDNLLYNKEIIISNQNEESVKQTNLISQLKKDLTETKNKLICVQREFHQEADKWKLMMSSSRTPNSNKILHEDSSHLQECSSKSSNEIVDFEEDKENDFLINPMTTDSQSSSISSAVDVMASNRNPPMQLRNLVRLISLDDEEDCRNSHVCLVENLDQMIEMISEMLPRLLESVGSKDNADIILLIVQSACLHPDSVQRERLLHMLIHLYPDPNAQQRMFVLRQIHRLAGYLGAFRIEAELISQLWEMLYCSGSVGQGNQLSTSMRVSLAQICSIVCLQAPVALRSSLLLSIQLQLLEDTNRVDNLCQADILASIAACVPYLADKDKLLPLIGHTLKQYWPHSGATSPMDSVVRGLVLPVMAQWALELSMLNSALVAPIMQSIHAEFEKLLDGQSSNYSVVLYFISLLKQLANFIAVWIKKSTPTILTSSDTVEIIQPMVDNSDVSLTSTNHETADEILPVGLAIEPIEYAEINTIYQNFLQSEQWISMTNVVPDQPVTAWPELYWLQTQLISPLIGLLGKSIIKPMRTQPQILSQLLDDTKVFAEFSKNQFNYSTHKSTELIHEMASCLYHLCVPLGPAVIQRCVIPSFQSYFIASNQLSNQAIQSAVLTGYCAVLLANVDSAEMSQRNTYLENLRRLLTNVLFLVSSDDLNIDGLKHCMTALRMLRRSTNCDLTNYLREIFLPVIQPALTSPDVSVRSLVCLILRDFIGQIHSNQLLVQQNLDQHQQHQLTHNSLHTQYNQQQQSISIEIHRDLLMTIQSLLDNSPISSDYCNILCIGPLVGLLQFDSLPIHCHSKVFDMLSALMNASNISDNDTNQANKYSEILITTLIQMVNVIGPLSSETYRNDVILPWLFGITELNNATSDLSRRSSIAMILYNTFSTLSYYLESKKAFELYLLPSLDRLKLDMQELYPDIVKEIDNMILDVRRRYEDRQKSTSGSITPTNSSSVNTGDVGQSVKNKLVSFINRNTDSSQNKTASNISNFFNKRR